MENRLRYVGCGMNGGLRFRKIPEGKDPQACEIGTGIDPAEDIVGSIVKENGLPRTGAWNHRQVWVDRCADCAFELTDPHQWYECRVCSRRFRKDETGIALDLSR